MGTIFYFLKIQCSNRSVAVVIPTTKPFPNTRNQGQGKDNMSEGARLDYIGCNRVHNCRYQGKGDQDKDNGYHYVIKYHMCPLIFTWNLPGEPSHKRLAGRLRIKKYAISVIFISKACHL